MKSNATASPPKVRTFESGTFSVMVMPPPDPVPCCPVAGVLLLVAGAVVLAGAGLVVP
ncbi:hypothetical protein JMUB6875_54130 [Nocardia sp. JMUB6875]